MPVAVQSLSDTEVAEVLLTFDDFIRMDDEGYFADLGKRTESINGRRYDLAPVSGGHGNTQAAVMLTLHDRHRDRISAMGARIVGNVTLPLFAPDVLIPVADLL